MTTKAETRRLASLRGLPLKGINAAVADEVLSFGEHERVRSWFIRDERAGCVRRLDGTPWVKRDGDAKALDLPGTSGLRVDGWPVGILRAKERQTVIVCEGGPDLLAAYAVREAIRGDFGIVCLLGSGLTIPESARTHFTGKHVRFIAHADATGREFAERNAHVLAEIAAQVSIANLDGLHTADGSPARDLCDALAFREPWQVPHDIVELFDFARTPPRVRIVPSQRSLFTPSVPGNEIVTKDNPTITHREHRKTQQMGRKENQGEDALHAKARELASLNRGEAYCKLFLLAQAVCRHFGHRDGKAAPLSATVFDTWFEVSRPNLDPKDSRAHYLARFRGLFRKVRVIADSKDTLAKAEERARNGPLPEIPDAPDAPHGWRMLAAVCRELQSAAGEAPFFIGTRDAGRIADDDPHPQKGSRVLEALSEFGVVRCVNKGKAVLGGDASEFRYLLP